MASEIIWPQLHHQLQNQPKYGALVFLELLRLLLLRLVTGCFQG